MLGITTRTEPWPSAVLQEDRIEAALRADDLARQRRTQITTRISARARHPIVESLSPDLVVVVVGSSINDKVYTILSFFCTPTRPIPSQPNVVELLLCHPKATLGNAQKYAPLPPSARTSKTLMEAAP